MSERAPDAAVSGEPCAHDAGVRRARRRDGGHSRGPEAEERRAALAPREAKADEAEASRAVLSRPTFIVAAIVWTLAIAGLVLDLGGSLARREGRSPAKIPLRRSPGRLSGRLTGHEYPFIITT
jgi:hypothetical protein